MSRFQSNGFILAPFATVAIDDGALAVEERYTRDGENGQIYSDIVWPRSRILAGTNQGGTPPWDHVALSYGMYQWITRLGGAYEPWQIIGQTLDQNNNPVANMTTLLVDVPNGVVADQQTTDNNGTYIVGSPYGAGRGFVYANIAGSPDLAGASDDNLP